VFGLLPATAHVFNNAASSRRPRIGGIQCKENPGLNNSSQLMRDRGPPAGSGELVIELVHLRLTHLLVTYDRPVRP